MPDAIVIHGDCLEVMAGMDAASVDAVVTDPPYGLAFMGKEWDHAVPGVEYWEACLRVLKPGGHLLAFGGTRLYHRLTCAIEDAGFEVRDCLMWLYGQGFPKSLDVSKAIDKMDAVEEQSRRRYRFTAWVRSTGITSREIDEATGTNMGGHYTTAASQPAIMTREHLEACRHLLDDVPGWVESECDRRTVESCNMARREVVGVRPGLNGSGFGNVGHGLANEPDRIKDTTPATDAAKQWHGWGTALKPAWEPVIMARKPLGSTVAACVCEHGTGAINVGGCRVGTDVAGWNGRSEGGNTWNGSNSGLRNNEDARPVAGRWPANVVLDEDAAAALDGQGGYSRDGWAGGCASGDRKPDTGHALAHGSTYPHSGYGSGGGPSRFFYTAKATKRDRGEGNRHPTVKPSKLMKWLVRMVTPPGGVVLDPFCGSGTTGVACVREGVGFIGIEREQEYVDIAERRLAGEQPCLAG